MHRCDMSFGGELLLQVPRAVPELSNTAPTAVSAPLFAGQCWQQHTAQHGWRQRPLLPWNSLATRQRG